MKFNFDCCFKEIKDINFHFGNIKSPYGANNLYFTKNDKPILPIAGELHFSRLPKEFWYKELLKMKDSGITVISTYVFWNYHEPENGKFNFSGDCDIAYFLSLCKEIELPCILRIGPWCHGEVVDGGLPKYIRLLPKKRCNNPKYLAYVKRYWTRLMQEVKPFSDGKTIIGIQLENEYGGSIEHIRTLRRIAEQIGFKTPFFTMTAWPTNKPDEEFLPMFGGYPEAPWTQNKKPLSPNNRFAITPAKTEAEIGGDLHKIQKGNELSFNDFPYASCELGPGNQVTQHRRPIISENDGYGVGFSHFASGMNWIGYYMYHGGRNPNYKPMQESKRTFYPNNYPVIDYDFQAPISRFGDCRSHADRLRLLHLFINTFDKKIALKQPFFPTEQRKSTNDISMPSVSIRANKQGEGYFFVSAYERGLEFKDYKAVASNIKCGETEISLPEIDIKSGSMFFYAFNIKIGSTAFDYILAQPITKITQHNKTVAYFTVLDGIEPRLSVNKKIELLPVNEPFTINDVQIVVLSKEKAMQLHRFDENVFFAQGNVFYHDGTPICEQESDCLYSFVSLEETSKQKLPYGYYLYSHGKRKYYELNIDKSILKDYYDVRFTFDFSGLNLQLFCGKTLLDDYFNTNGKYVIRLREFKEYIEKYGKLIIKTAPPSSFGIGKVYNEISLKSGENSLALNSVKAICPVNCDT